MARTLGTYSLSANIEMLAGAPLDAREIVPAKADLTTSGMFPYAYIGMETYVVAENKKYRLIGIDPTVPTNWEEATGGSDVVQGYYVDGHFYKYSVVEGSYGEDGTTDFYTLVDYGYMTMWEPVSNPQLNTIYYDSKHTPHKAYMWTGSAYTDQVSGEITGDTRDWYVDLTTKTTYYYNGSAFVMTVDGTLMDKKTYSMSDHYITSLSDGTKFGFIDYIENLESVLVTAIGDHATWVSGLVTTPAADHTYDIVDHEVIETQMTPASHTVTEWVSNLNTAFVNAISDHATWISGLNLTNVSVTNTNPTSSTDYYPVWHTSTSGTSGLKANNGLKYNTIEGTASAVGKGQLQLGNSTSSGTVGNKTGSILLFSEKNGYAIIKPTASSTNERIFTLPDKAGTVALTSDIITYSMTRNGQTVTLTPSSGTAQSFTLSDLINGLSTGDSDPVDGDYYVSQYVNGGTTTVTYHRRPVSKLYNYIKGKLGIASSGSTFLKKDGTWATPDDTKVTITNTNPASSTFYYPVWHTSTSGTTGVNANDGFRYETAQGTTTNTGFSVIWLGNSTSAGTAGNKRGVLNLYSNNNGYVTLRTNETSTSKRDIYFPDKSGTIALTSDITDTKNTAGSTDTSSKIFLIGATSQAANPQTYSDNEVYVTNGVLTTKKTQIGGTSVTLEYNSSTKSLDFIF